MTLKVYESLDSMSGSVSKEQGESTVKEVRRRYVVGQCESFDDCVTQVEPYVPAYVSSGLGYWNRTQLSVTAVGNKYFDVTAVYRTLVPPSKEDEQGGDSPVAGSVSWDTTGHTEHITQAKSQTRLPANAPDFYHAINVSGDAVNGIDIVRPTMRYSETWVMPINIAMSCDFINAIYTLTGTVNQAAFRCFDPGEALFLGARGQWQEDQPYVVVTFEFEARPNIIEYPFAGAGDQWTKRGWEHVWILYEDDVNADKLVKLPVAAYKSVVYSEADWADLLIATANIANARSGLAAQAAGAQQPGGFGGQ